MDNLLIFGIIALGAFLCVVYVELVRLARDTERHMPKSWKAPKEKGVNGERM